MRPAQQSGRTPGVRLSGASEFDPVLARRDGAGPLLTSRRARSQRIARYAIAGSASYGFGLVRPAAGATRATVRNGEVPR